MGKKRARDLDGGDQLHIVGGATAVDVDAESNEDFDMVNVEFEWFNYDPEVDFHGVKALLRQLLDVDASLFNISALADLVLSQPTIGSTVKVDGKDTDAYAMLTALNTYEHRAKEPMKDLLAYIVDKAKTNEALREIPGLIESDKHVGLVLSERLINMPSEIGPPLYTMLLDELKAAVEDKEPYSFSHYLILSKTYQEVESQLDVDERQRKKAREDASTYYFHPEDEEFHNHAMAFGSYPFSKQEDAVADSKRAFQEMGIRSMGHMILIEASKFEEAVKGVTQYLRPQ